MNPDIENDSDDELSAKASSAGRQVIVVFDKASLETVKTKAGEYQLLNCDDHLNLMKKYDKDPAHYRPDIIHQELMAVLDSPLNKAGLISKIYIHTEKHVLIEVNKKTRIPRTFKRFSGLMVQLLHKLKIRSSDGRDVLFKVIKNPLTNHLPAGIRSYGFSQRGTLFSPSAFGSSIPDNAPIVLLFGAMAVGSVEIADHPYIEQTLSISEYPLSGVVAVNRVIGAIEAHWGIV